MFNKFPTPKNMLKRCHILKAVVQCDYNFRVMIEYHPNIQFFINLPMWQGGSPLLFEFFYFLKIN
jgi:hypothetical protein